MSNTNDEHKLKAVTHSFKQFRNKHMVKDKLGVYIGSNAVYINNNEIKSFHCPTIFNNIREAEYFIKVEEEKR